MCQQEKKFIPPSPNPNSIRSFSSRKQAPVLSTSPELRVRQDAGSFGLPGVTCVTHLLRCLFLWGISPQL